VESETGSLTIKYRDSYYSLFFARNGWLAAELVQYLDEVLTAADPEVAILKLLGYTMQIGTESPARQADHWVEVDLAGRELTTNSPIVRQAVDQQPVKEGQPYGSLTLKRLYRVLDEHDFTVRFRR
jgi:hypothetical protein